jgi:hypothetical protein
MIAAYEDTAKRPLFCWNYIPYPNAAAPSADAKLETIRDYVYDWMLYDLSIFI